MSHAVQELDSSLNTSTNADVVRRSTTRIVADGVQLAVHRIGSGVPVICLSAIGHDAHDFDELAARVSDHVELIFIE